MSSGYVIPHIYAKAYCACYIFSVDFGCFSTGNRHCEGLWEREEQDGLHAFLMSLLMDQMVNDLTFDILDLPLAVTILVHILKLRFSNKYSDVRRSPITKQ